MDGFLSVVHSNQLWFSRIPMWRQNRNRFATEGKEIARMQMKERQGYH